MPTDEVTFSVSEFDNGRFEWNSFDLNAKVNKGTDTDRAFTTLMETTVPAPVAFRGGRRHASGRWKTHCSPTGRCRLAPTDLAQLMMIEYASGYGNDWFVVPLTVPVGSVTSVNSLVVTDTFGVRRYARRFCGAPGDNPIFGTGTSHMMTLMTGILGLGHHLGGWRHRDSWPNTVMNIEHAIWIAKEAERGKLDLVFIADGNAVRQMDKPTLFAANSPSDRPAVFEPVTMLSAVAMFTKSIGLLATATTTYEEPYLMARKFGSLDHLSKGRACWNIVTTSFPGDSVNFGKPVHPPRPDRYERAEEFVEVCKGLWDSWAADAFIEDKAAGHYLDPKRVHTLNHAGKHFSVQGPLNVARLPQGYPVMFMAGQSELGREFAAKTADCLFSVTDTIEDGKALYNDVKGRLGKYGRNPDDLRIMPGCSVYIGRTSAEADELYEELQSLISPELGVPYLSKMVNEKLEGLPLDGPMPDLSAEVNAISSFRKSISAMAQRENLTIRQTYQRVLPSMGHIVFKGSPSQVADEMETWYRSKACDGFNVLVPVLPGGLTAFVDLVVPELQKRKVFKKDYVGNTLRERMGLQVPTNPYFA